MCIRSCITSRVYGRVSDVTYHLQNDPPPEAWRRLDPGPFERRGDDTEGVLRRRLDAYRREADGFKEHYERQGILTVVDARRPIDDVAADVLGALGHPESPRRAV